MWLHCLSLPTTASAYRQVTATHQRSFNQMVISLVLLGFAGCLVHCPGCQCTRTFAAVVVAVLSTRTGETTTIQKSVTLGRKTKKITNVLPRRECNHRTASARSRCSDLSIHHDLCKARQSITSASKYALAFE
jgi:hypothetical protein